MNRSFFLRDFGPWAIVTGASSGMGRQFAEELAGLGLNIVLVARRDTILEQVGAEIETINDVQTRAVALDLEQADFLPKLAEKTADLDIGLVISNAGADQMGALLRVPLEKLRAMQRLNAASHLDIAHHFGSRFLATRKKAGILFVSSTASLQATPLAANYAGAKAYVRMLSMALHSELKKTGIHVSVLIPGPTSTPAFNDRKDIDLKSMPMEPMPVKPVVRSGLNAIAKNKPYVIPGVMNSMLDFIGRKIVTRAMATHMWGMLTNKAAPDRLKISGDSCNSRTPSTAPTSSSQTN